MSERKETISNLGSVKVQIGIADTPDTTGISFIDESRNLEQRVLLAESIADAGSTETLETPASNKKNWIYEDEHGERWLLQKAVTHIYNISVSTVYKLVKNNTRSKQGLAGKNTIFYSEKDILANEKFQQYVSLPFADEQTGVFMDENNERWIIKSKLAANLNLLIQTLDRHLEGVLSIPGRTKNGETALYKESEVLANERIKYFLSLPEVDAEGILVDENGERWMSKAKLYQICKDAYHISYPVFINHLQNVSDKPGRTHAGETVLYKEAELLQNFGHLASVRTLELGGAGQFSDEDGEIWIIKKRIAEKLGVSPQTLDKYLVHVASQTIRSIGRGAMATSIFYKESEVLANVDIQQFISLPVVNENTSTYVDENGEEWRAITSLVKLIGLKNEVLQKIVPRVSQQPGRTTSGATVIYKVSELLSLPDLKHFLEFPRSKNGRYVDNMGVVWRTVNSLSNEVGINFKTLAKNLQDCTYIIGHTSTKNRQSFLYKESEAVEKINNMKHEGSRGSTALKGELIELLQKQNLSSSEFIRMITIFGGSYGADILFRYHPQFKNLPIEEVKSILSEYLGQYLTVKGKLNLEDFDVVVRHLSDLNVQDALYEIIKTGGLDALNKKKRGRSLECSEDIINVYLDEIQEQATTLQSLELQAVIDRAREYYGSVFQDFPKPPQIVDRLREGRRFPDENQLINIKEVYDKKKLVIADEMGLGKSGSLILAKETLGVRTAVVVAPSSVISTWEKYLSDKGGGYFQEGQAPQVLVVENKEQLSEAIEKNEVYDYIVISQERLTPQYVELLQKIEYGLLGVDEIHRLKNVKKGKRSQSLQRLAKKIHDEDQYLILLSGTPAPNKVQDIAIILKLIYPELFSSMDNKSLVRGIVNGDLIDLRSLLLPRMQRKRLAESIDIPPFEEQIIHIEQSDLEKEVYEVLVDEEEELTAPEKLQLLRQYLLNHDIVDSTPGIPNAKIERVSAELKADFQNHRSIIMFVNGYIEGVMRGDNTIFSQLDIPEGVEIRLIEGSVSKDQRQRIVDEIKSSDRKFLFVVSGQTSGVGEDFSFADGSYLYNEPWTREEVKQEYARNWREGVQHSITGKTFVVEDTIEEGIHLYIREKEKAIEKLLQGIPISEMQKELLLQAEKQVNPNLEVNADLAKYYFSTWDKMRKIFMHVSEMGEEEFMGFLEQYGKEYAEGYMNIGRRSYQANASRVCGTLIDRFVRENNQQPQDVAILDIASGPEMLRRHSPDQYHNQIVSLDMNEHQFAHSTDDMHKVGSFLHMPYFENETFDYTNVSLAFDHTIYEERIRLLMEANRVTKKGGRMLINMIYSLDIKNITHFNEIAYLLGWKVIEEYTGTISEGSKYRSHMITLEKVEFSEADVEVVKQTIGKDSADGLEFQKTGAGLKNSRAVIKQFLFGDNQTPVVLNEEDTLVVQEEEDITKEGDMLKQQYGEIKSIPREEIIDRGFIRIFINNKYILFKKLQKANGVVIIR